MRVDFFIQSTLHEFFNGQDPSTTAFAGTASGFTPDIAKTYAKYTGKKTAIISATEFTKKDQYVDFTFTVQNDSEDLNATITSADISIPAGNTYLSAELVGTVNLNLAPQATGDFTVRVKCLKTPTAEQKWENFVITITANPAETTGA